jgi:glycosyltransferase involved in cell wall biosynthesis
MSQQLEESLINTNHVIVNSKSTKTDLCHLFNYPDEKVTVIPLGVSNSIQRHEDENIEDKVLKRYSLKHKGYFIYIGTIEPRKNIATLIQAFDTFCKNVSEEFLLVLVGRNGWKTDDFYYSLSHMNYKNNVRILGYVSEDIKKILLKRARVFIYPSMYEGFGLPVLEAMSYGIPVITSNNSALAEIANSAAALIDPKSIQEITSSLENIISDEKIENKLSEAGLERVKQYTWENNAKLLHKTFTRVIGN